MKFFEILGMCENEDLYSLKTRIYTTCECKTAYLKKVREKRYLRLKCKWSNYKKRYSRKSLSKDSHP